MQKVGASLTYTAVRIDREDLAFMERMLFEQEVRGRRPVFIKDGVLILEESANLTISPGVRDYLERVRDNHGTMDIAQTN